MWSIWHNVVAINSWRAQIVQGIDTSCKCCTMDMEEFPLHKFYLYHHAQEVWEYS